MNIKRFRKRSAYGADKENKKNNYNLINDKYCKIGQTVLAGDSITEIFNMELFDEYTDTSGLRVYNRGISGDTTDRLLERFDENVLALKPKNLVLLIGVNDFGINADVNYTFENIKQILLKAKNIENNTKIVLQSVYPVDVKRRQINKKVLQLNEKLKAFAEQNDIVYLNIYSLLLDSNGGLDPKYTYDGLHPNTQGFEIVASEIIKSLM